MARADGHDAGHQPRAAGVHGGDDSAAPGQQDRNAVGDEDGEGDVGRAGDDRVAAGCGVGHRVDDGDTRAVALVHVDDRAAEPLLEQAPVLGDRRRVVGDVAAEVEPGIRPRCSPRRSGR